MKIKLFSAFVLPVFIAYIFLSPAVTQAKPRTIRVTLHNGLAYTGTVVYKDANLIKLKQTNGKVVEIWVRAISTIEKVGSTYKERYSNYHKVFFALAIFSTMAAASCYFICEGHYEEYNEATDQDQALYFKKKVRGMEAATNAFMYGAISSATLGILYMKLVKGKEYEKNSDFRPY